METAHQPLSLLLRARTQEAHEAVETGTRMTRLVAKRIPPEDPSAERARKVYEVVYRVYLSAALGVEEAIRSGRNGAMQHGLLTVGGYPEEVDDACALLAKDLEDIGGRFTLHSSPRLPSITDLPSFLGTEYVIRGSRNGNVVIASEAQHNLGYCGNFAARFLNMYGRETRSHFRKFADWMNSAPLGQGERERVCEVANQTFAAIGEYFRVADVFLEQHSRQTLSAG
jgi:heme oxygenase